MARPKRIINQEDTTTMEAPIPTPIPIPIPTPTPIIPILASIKERRLFRVSEVADMFDVSERAVYLWIENGHLQTELTPGKQWRITGESIDACRFRKKVDKPEEAEQDTI